MEAGELEAHIRRVFASTPAPTRLVDSLGGGFEPELVVQDFADKTVWQALTAPFLDQAPCGLASALSFFSNEALRFYLPAYMIADVRQMLATVAVCRRLSCFTAAARQQLVGEGGRTWFDYDYYRFSVFTPEEAGAIVAYLEYQRGLPGTDIDEAKAINESLASYWVPRSCQRAV